MSFSDLVLVLVFLFMISFLLVDSDWQGKTMCALGAELLFGMFYFISYSIAGILG